MYTDVTQTWFNSSVREPIIRKGFKFIQDGKIGNAMQ